MNEIKIREFIRAASNYFNNDKREVFFQAGNVLKEKTLSFRKYKTDLPNYTYSPFKIEVLLNIPVSINDSTRILETSLGEFDLRDLLNRPERFYSDLMNYIDELVYQLTVGV